LHKSTFMRSCYRDLTDGLELKTKTLTPGFRDQDRATRLRMKVKIISLVKLYRHFKFRMVNMLLICRSWPTSALIIYHPRKRCVMCHVTFLDLGKK